MRNRVAATVCLGVGLWALGAALTATPIPAQEPQDYRIVCIETAGPEEIYEIGALGIDILRVDGDTVTAHVGPADRRVLEEAGIAYAVTVADVPGYLRQQEEQARAATAELLYHAYEPAAGYAPLIDDLYALEASGVARVYDIGDSIEGRDILAVRISDNPDQSEGEPATLLLGAHHAREFISLEVPLLIAQHLCDGYATDPDIQALVDGGEIWVVPLVNPDGHQYAVDTYRLWRKNRRNNGGTYGVDLNRNYAKNWGGAGSSALPGSETYHGTAPFSEPESQAVRDLFTSWGVDFKGMISYHSYGQYIMYPWGYTTIRAPHHYHMDRIGQMMDALVTSVHGLDYTLQKSSALYPASGTTDDWTYDVTAIPSYTIELRSLSSFVLPATEIEPTFEENLPAALRLIELTQVDEDGDGVVEVDDNCIGLANPGQTDADGDLVGPPCDCDDTNAGVSPGAVELCTNDVDDDCDGLVDGEDPDCIGGSEWSAARDVEAASRTRDGGAGSRVVNALAILLAPALVLVGRRHLGRRG